MANRLRETVSQVFLSPGVPDVHLSDLPVDDVPLPEVFQNGSCGEE